MDDIDQSRINLDRSRIELDKAQIVETQGRTIANLSRLDKFNMDTIIKAVVANDLTLLNRLSKEN